MTALLSKARIAFAFLFVLCAATFLAAQKPIENDDLPTMKVPDGAGGFIETARAKRTVTTGNGINYHGGPVLQGNPVPIYIIWYGNWTNGPKASDSALTVSLIEAFLASNSLGGSGYEAINTTYGDNTGNVSGHLNFANAVFDNYSQGKRFNDSGLQSIVNRHVGHDLPADAGAVYAVLTSSDINETSGFCRTYCGFHTRATLNGVDIKYAFIGNVDKCPSGCEIQST